MLFRARIMNASIIIPNIYRESGFLSLLAQITLTLAVAVAVTLYPV